MILDLAASVRHGLGFFAKWCLLQTDWGHTTGPAMVAMVPPQAGDPRSWRRPKSDGKSWSWARPKRRRRPFPSRSGPCWQRSLATITSVIQTDPYVVASRCRFTSVGFFHIIPLSTPCPRQQPPTAKAFAAQAAVAANFLCLLCPKADYGVIRFQDWFYKILQEIAGHLPWEHSFAYQKWGQFHFKWPPLPDKVRLGVIPDSFRFRVKILTGEPSKHQVVLKKVGAGKHTHTHTAIHTHTSKTHHLVLSALFPFKNETTSWCS